MSEFFKIIFGEYTGVQLAAYTFFFFIGYAIYALTEITGRNVQSTNTPQKFSWKFWFYDNWRRYLATILCTYVLFRFGTEINGHPFGYFDAVTLGLVGDGIAATVKSRVKGMVDADRPKLMAELKVDEQQPVNNNVG